MNVGSSASRVLLAVVLALVIALGVASTARAETYPSRPIKIVVPFPPGGATDILGRIVGQKLQETWGQPVVIDNRPGAAGNVGMGQVAKATPDGYTLVMGTAPTHAINRHLYAKLPFDPEKDFAPVTLVAAVPNILVVTPSLPATSVKELIALAKSQPGRLNFGSSGSGATHHLNGELFKIMTGVDMVHVPYKGSAPALADLMGGQIQLMFDNMPSALPQVKAGKLRALAVTSAKRSPAAPDVPTMAEAGVPGFEATAWFALFAPAGTPGDIVTQLNTTIAKHLTAPDMRDRLLTMGGEFNPMTPEQFAAFIRAESVKWGEVVKKSGARID
jgi:tripartite-type tricarboxylate transporter receptor subunit TctC